MKHFRILIEALKYRCRRCFSALLIAKSHHSEPRFLHCLSVWRLIRSARRHLEHSSLFHALLMHLLDMRSVKQKMRHDHGGYVYIYPRADASQHF